MHNAECKVHNAKWRKAKPLNGGVAQLGEHLPCKQGVMGSNPIISTKKKFHNEVSLLTFLFKESKW